MKNLAIIIPVRLSSSRIIEKPLLKFGNDTLLSWKIKQLLKVVDKKQIIVTTNSEKLKSIANKFDVTIHNREDWLCEGHKSTVSQQVENVIKDITNYEHIAWTLITSPLMRSETYKACFDTYFKVIKNGYDSLMTVNLMKDFLWNDNGPLNYKSGIKHVYTQDLPNIYRVTNATNIISRQLALKYKYYLGKNPYKYIVSKIEGIDIDNYEDYIIAKKLKTGL